MPWVKARGFFCLHAVRKTYILMMSPGETSMRIYVFAAWSIGAIARRCTLAAIPSWRPFLTLEMTLIDAL